MAQRDDSASLLSIQDAIDAMLRVVKDYALAGQMNSLCMASSRSLLPFTISQTSLSSLFEQYASISSIVTNVCIPLVPLTDVIAIYRLP